MVLYIFWHVLHFFSSFPYSWLFRPTVLESTAISIFVNVIFILLDYLLREVSKNEIIEAKITNIFTLLETLLSLLRICAGQRGLLTTTHLRMSKHGSCIYKYFPQACNSLYGGVHGTFSPVCPSFCNISFKYLTCGYYPVQVFMIKSNFPQRLHYFFLSEEI